MINPKVRRLLILLHLYGAAFMAPAFLLVAITGGMHLVGVGEKVATTPIELPAGTVVDIGGETSYDDIRAILSAANVDVKFETIKGNGANGQTRPSSRPYVQFSSTPDGVSATLNKPNSLKAMMEIHKGHGPNIVRTYHKLVALMLFFVVFGGIFVGLLAKAYRRKTVGALALGSVLYVLLVLFA